MKEGMEHAWGLLAARDPRDVCERAEADYSADQLSYVLPVLGHPILVDLAQRTLTASSAEGAFTLTKMAHFSHLSILHYLLGAQKIVPTGRLVKPTDLKSGQVYVKGSHALPLGGIATRYSRNPQAFAGQAARFGGQRRSYGDVAVELRPFSRVPVTLILWLEDEEFPARSYLLFDDTCEIHLPPDIVWSVAMMCALAMLKG